MELQIIEQREVLGKEFKIYGTIENPLFLAKDVAEWIDYAYKDARKVSRDVSKMLKTVDDDEKVKSTLKLGGEDYSHGGVRENTEMWFLTEDGLYEVLMQSRKPIAKAFKKEVKKILKQIRQTGGYIPTSQEDTDAEIMAKALLIAQKTIENKNKLIEELKPIAEKYTNIYNSDKLYNTTDIAKDLGMSARKLNSILYEKEVIYRKGNTWYLYSKYEHMIPEYADYKITEYGQQLKWTNKGREFIINLLDK